MKNRREVVRNQKLVLCSTLLLMVTIVVFTCFFSSIKTQAAPADKTYKYYTSIQVESGDTLWNIACEYMTDDYSNINTYIDEICSINQLTDCQIHAGEYLTIPYYSTEIME